MYKKVFLIVLRKFHRKIPVLESLWARTQVLYCEIYKIFKNTYFEEHLLLFVTFVTHHNAFIEVYFVHTHTQKKSPL